MFAAISNSTQAFLGRGSVEKDKEDRSSTSANTISLATFRDALDRYPDVLARFSKPPKEGSLSLEELDDFRYVEAPSRLSKDGAGETFDLETLQKLVQWKITHGQFRPTLPKLVASNSDESVKSATEAAFSHHAANPTSITETLKLLSTPLRGVGPATASLLLSINDPSNVIFFSDEVYAWLVSGGKKVSLKYTANEFSSLNDAVQPLQERLEVTPVEIEKVAFVLMKEDEPVKVAKEKPEPTGRKRGRPKLEESEKKIKKAKVSGRGRGRPPLPESEKALRKQKVPGRGRGRPPGSTKKTVKADVDEKEGKDERDEREVGTAEAKEEDDASDSA